MTMMMTNYGDILIPQQTVLTVLQPVPLSWIVIKCCSCWLKPQHLLSHLLGGHKNQGWRSSIPTS